METCERAGVCACARARACACACTRLRACMSVALPGLDNAVMTCCYDMLLPRRLAITRTDMSLMRALSLSQHLEALLVKCHVVFA